MGLSLSTNGIGNYNLNWYARLVNAANIATVRAYVDGYSSKANCQSNTATIVSAPQGAAFTANTTWQKFGSTSTITGLGANITWGRVHFFIASSKPSTVVNIDGVRLL